MNVLPLVQQDGFLVLKAILSQYQVQLAFLFHLITDCKNFGSNWLRNNR